MHNIEIRDCNVLWGHKSRGHNNMGRDSLINQGYVSVPWAFVVVLRWNHGSGIPPPPLHPYGGLFIYRNNPPRGYHKSSIPQSYYRQSQLYHQNIPHVNTASGDTPSLQVHQ